MIFSDDVRDSLPVHLPIMYIAFRSEDIVEKVGFWASEFYGEGIPHISGMHFKSHSLRACGRFWLSSVQETRRVADEKRKKKKRRRKNRGKT